MDGTTKPEVEAAAEGGDTVTEYVSEEDEAHTQQYERRIQEQAKAQLQRLRDEARALFGMVNGRPGVTSPREWAKLLDQAGDFIGNGRFIVRCLGAERYLDAETVAVLITLRQNLIAELPRPSTADLMMIDAAVVAYYNMLRVQGWIGNLALVVESELFGNGPFRDLDGEATAERLQNQFRRLGEQMLPLLEKCHRMMARSLALLPPNSRASDDLRPALPTKPGSRVPVYRERARA